MEHPRADVTSMPAQSELKNKHETRRVWVLRVPYKGECRDEVRNGKVYLSEDLSSKRATPKALQ